MTLQGIDQFADALSQRMSSAGANSSVARLAYIEAE
jgi:hypothetical protein